MYNRYFEETEFKIVLLNKITMERHLFLFLMKWNENIEISMFTFVSLDKWLSPHPPVPSCFDNIKWHAFLMGRLFSYVLPAATNALTEKKAP